MCFSGYEMVLVINYDKKVFCGLCLFLYFIFFIFRDCNFMGKNVRRGDRKYFLIFLYVNIFIILI